MLALHSSCDLLDMGSLKNVKKTACAVSMHSVAYIDLYVIDR